MAEIISIEKLLAMNLAIPPYQRPYKWTAKNMLALLEDIGGAIDDAQKYEGFRYRVGTVILHKEGDCYNIVDGQQRVLSFILIMRALGVPFCCPLLERSEFSSPITKSNLYKNFLFAKDYLACAPKESFRQAMQSTVEVVVLTVDDIAEAFQLFDSQNTRGRALDPHDLLKAYHLREMQSDIQAMHAAVTKWESFPTKSIRELFAEYLFPIYHWTRGRKSRPFAASEIDTYKGVSVSSDYTYAKRAYHAVPYFQISDPIPSGECFFEMVAHYLQMLDDVKREIENKEIFSELKTIIYNKEYKSSGFGYVTNLFYCALLCYYDKFHNFDGRAVNKLFLWAYMLRVDLEVLGYDSVNKYAIGEGERYTNIIDMFSRIRDARSHTEISSIAISTVRRTENASATRWDGLYEQLKRLSGVKGNE